MAHYGSIEIEVDKEEADVSILGTGNYGQALAKKLVKSGLRVTIGSRNPGDLKCGLTSVNKEKALRPSGKFLVPRK